MGYNRDNCYEVNTYPKKELDELCRNLYGRISEGTVSKGSFGKDGGKDVLICMIDGKSVAVQCKTESKKIGVGPIREFDSVCRLAKAKGEFISTSGFTSDAEKLAKTLKIKLMDLGDLIVLGEQAGMIFYYFTDGAVPSIKSPEKKEVCVVSFFFSGAVGSGGKNRVAVDKSDFHSFSGKNPVRVIMRTGHHKIIFTNSNKDIQSFEVDIDGSGSYLVSMSLTFKYRLEFIPGFD